MEDAVKLYEIRCGDVIGCIKAKSAGHVLKSEPNAAGQAGQDVITAPSQEGHAAGPAPAAPDVESMVRRINAQFDECCTFGGHWDRMRDVALEAAALSQLGQGWVSVEAIPPLAENAYGLRELYARNHHGKCFRLELPPPPERP